MGQAEADTPAADPKPPLPDSFGTEPVTPITLEWRGGTKWAFRPQSDMTPLESALISQLFIKLVLQTWKGGVLNWPQYIHDNKLSRHFAVFKEKRNEVW